MKAAIHSVEGFKETRRSPRTYTHAVIGSWNGVRCVEQNQKGWADLARQSFAYEVREANPMTRRYTHDAAALAAIAESAALGEAEYVARYVKAQTDGHMRGHGVPGILQWSMSEENARKSVGAWTKRGFDGVCVVPVLRRG